MGKNIILPKSYDLIEKCPICNHKLEFILDEDDFVIEGWCPRCGIMFDSENLLVEKEREHKKIWDYYK